MNILLVEDDRTIASGLEYSLTQEGFETFFVNMLPQQERSFTIKLLKLTFAYLTFLCRMEVAMTCAN